MHFCNYLTVSSEINQGVIRCPLCLDFSLCFRYKIAHCWCFTWLVAKYGVKEIKAVVVYVYIVPMS